MNICMVTCRQLAVTDLEPNRALLSLAQPKQSLLAVKDAGPVLKGPAAGPHQVRREQRIETGGLGSLTSLAGTFTQQ